MIQALGLENDIHRLVPGDVFQAQGEVAFDRIGNHQVEAGEVGQQLQHRANLDVLEVERQAFAGKTEFLFLFLFLFFLGNWRHFDRINAIGLVGEVFEIGVGDDTHANVGVFLNRIDVIDRSSEIADIHAALKFTRQLRADQFDMNYVIFAPYVCADRGAGQIDYDAAFAIRATLEIDIGNALGDRYNRCCAGARGVGGAGGGCSLGFGAAIGQLDLIAAGEGQGYLVAANAGGVVRFLRKIQHHAGAILRSRGDDTLHRAYANLHVALLELVFGFAEIERDACRFVDGKSARSYRILVESKHDLYRIPRHHRVIESDQGTRRGVAEGNQANRRQRGFECSGYVHHITNTVHGCFLSLLDQRDR